MMRAALGVSEANAPLAGRRMRSASYGSVGIVRQARPRSAVTVSPTAPGLAPLTGFSRSGYPIHNDRLSGAPLKRHSGRTACRGLEACATLLSETVAHTPFRRPLESRRRQRPLHVRRQLVRWRDGQPAPAATDRTTVLSTTLVPRDPRPGGCRARRPVDNSVDTR